MDNDVYSYVYENSAYQYASSSTQRLGFWECNGVAVSLFDNSFFRCAGRWRGFDRGSTVAHVAVQGSGSPHIPQTYVPPPSGWLSSCHFVDNWYRGQQDRLVAQLELT